MKAIAKVEDKPGLHMVDAPMPEIGPYDVLIKIKKTAICGTDMHIYNWDAWARQTVPRPLTIGHEFMGVIEAVGSEVKAFKPGERVSAEGHITCGHCRSCRAGYRHLCVHTEGIGYHRTGAFAEYLSVPAVNVYPMPDDIPDDVVAILDPLGNSVHTALAYDLVGEDVLITGAGPVGLMAAAIAKHVGARHVVITDMNEYRLDLASKIKGCIPVNIKHESLDNVSKRLNMYEGFDVGLEMSGNNQAISDMINHMRHGGKIALLGISPSPVSVNWDHLVFKSLNLKGIYGREIFETWYKMCAMLQSGLDVTPILTHQFDADDFEIAFETMNSGHSGKVILNWS